MTRYLFRFFDPFPLLARGFNQPPLRTERARIRPPELRSAIHVPDRRTDDRTFLDDELVCLLTVCRRDRFGEWYDIILRSLHSVYK